MSEKEKGRGGEREKGKGLRERVAMRAVHVLLKETFPQMEGRPDSCWIKWRNGVRHEVESLAHGKREKTETGRTHDGAQRKKTIEKKKLV